MIKNIPIIYGRIKDIDFEGKMATIIKNNNNHIFKTLINYITEECDTVCIISKNTDKLYYDELIQHGHIIINTINEPNMIPNKYINDEKIIIDAYEFMKEREKNND